MSLFSTSDTNDNPTWLTPWSFIHFMSGVVFYKIAKIIFPDISLLNNFLIWFLVHTLYEVKDYYKSYIDYDGSGWNNNSLINSIGDTISAILGFFIGYIIFNGADIKLFYIVFSFYILVLGILLYRWATRGSE